MAAVGQEPRFAVGADRAGIEDVRFPEAQPAEEPEIGGAQVEEILALEGGHLDLGKAAPIAKTLSGKPAFRKLSRTSGPTS